MGTRQWNICHHTLTIWDGFLMLVDRIMGTTGVFRLSLRSYVECWNGRVGNNKLAVACGDGSIIETEEFWNACIKTNDPLKGLDFEAAELKPFQKNEIRVCVVAFFWIFLIISPISSVKTPFLRKKCRGNERKWKITDRRKYVPHFVGRNSD